MSNSQTNDTLNKYSYSISGFCFEGNNKGGIDVETGFFIKKDSSLFLITAKHVLAGCKGSIKQKYYAQPMSVNLNAISFSGEIKVHESYPIDNSIIRDTSKCTIPFYMPDVIAYPAADPKKLLKNVLCIDNYILPKNDSKGDLEIWGYPAIENSKTIGVFKIVPPSHLEFPEKTYEILTFANTNLGVDSFNYIIYVPNTIFDSTLGGYSGSPVFIKEKDKTTFIGVLCAGQGHQLDVVKREFILPKVGY